MTKDEASDLKSLIEGAERRAIELENAKQAKAQADRVLESWLHMHTQQPNIGRKE